MKKTIFFAAAAVAALAAVSCQKFSEETVPANEEESVFVSFIGERTDFNGVKSTYDNGVTKWLDNDEIILVNLTNKKTDFLTASKTSSDGRSTTFSGTCSNFNGNETSFAAVYPSDAAYSVSSNKISVNAKAAQDGTFAKANICTATTGSLTKGNTNITGHLTFLNVGAILHFTQTDLIEKIVVTGNKAIAGEGTTITASFTAGTSDIFIAVDPVEECTFSFDFYVDDEVVLTINDKTKTLEANTMYEMGTIVYQKP